MSDDGVAQFDERSAGTVHHPPARELDAEVPASGRVTVMVRLSGASSAVPGVTTGAFVDGTCVAESALLPPEGIGVVS